MWHLVLSNYNEYGVIFTDASNQTTHLCRVSNDESPFWVKALAHLTYVGSDANPSDFPDWVKLVEGTILLSFESDSPLTYLKTHYPEYCL